MAGNSPDKLALREYHGIEHQDSSSRHHVAQLANGVLQHNTCPVAANMNECEKNTLTRRPRQFETFRAWI